MTRKPILLSGIAVAVILLGILILLVPELTTPEPAYQGIKLSSWMDGSFFKAGKLRKDQQQVFQRLGPDSIPWLLKTAALPELPGERRYSRWYSGSKLAHDWLPVPWSYRRDFLRRTAKVLLTSVAPGSAFEGQALNAVAMEFINDLKTPSSFDVSLNALAKFGKLSGPFLYKEAKLETDPIIRPVGLALEIIDPELYRKLELERSAMNR